MGYLTSYLTSFREPEKNQIRIGRVNSIPMDKGISMFRIMESGDHKAEYGVRYLPLVHNSKARAVIGFVLLILSAISAATIIGKRGLDVIIPIAVSAWALAVFLTDKYVHKYPQRYLTYLFASHMKFAIIMAFFFWIMGGIVGVLAVPHDVLWTSYFIFIFSDALASLPRKREIPVRESSSESGFSRAEGIADDRPGDSSFPGASICQIDTKAVMDQISSEPDEQLVEFIRKNLPELHGVAGGALILEEESATANQIGTRPVGLLVSRIRLNDVRRLNRFLLSCAGRIPMGCYFVCRYLPLENVAKQLKHRYTGLLYWPVYILHFIWYRAFPKIPWLNALYFSLTNGRNRVLSKVEIWGRLSYCGMRVIGESPGKNVTYLIAQRVAPPLHHKKPSYYPIVALEKVGLGGETVRTHKIRTMFPFSEFLQKRIFEDHGLAPTGKFANDFRLTEYGKFLRKYWLDEVPQIFDWLRGDVKLVGMRATSRHFLSLYPRELYDLYIQTKPGLIPPIFDESTSGLDKIIEVELTYLRSYRERPIRTDIQYLIQTFTDIVFRGVRSK
jgi:lipopolysaccharide/colanic/teichoic acid biosynthesis glycosyltransferase